MLGKLRRVPRRAADRMEQPLARAVDRMSRRAPVIEPEYSFDPPPRWGWTEPPQSAIEQRPAAGRDRDQVAVAQIGSGWPDVFDRREPGDVFLIDGDHLAVTNRFHGEQYALGAFVRGGHEGWRVEAPTWRLGHDAWFEAAPDPAWSVIESTFGRVGSSFWMERT